MKAWENLVKQSTYGGENWLRELEEQREGVRTFVDILKLLHPKMSEEEEDDGQSIARRLQTVLIINFESASNTLTSYMLPLLHRMCKKFPSFLGPAPESSNLPTIDFLS